MRSLSEWSYRHHTKPPMNAYGYFAGFIADCRPQVIVDRFHWSEPPYGNTYRGTCELSNAEWIKLELMCMAQGAKVLYMEDDISSIESRWSDDEMFPSDHLEQLKDEYEKIISRSRLPYVRKRLFDCIDKNGNLNESFAKIIYNHIEGSRGRLCKIPPPSIGAGNLESAEFIVIGPSPILEGMKKDSDIQFPLPLGCAEDSFWYEMNKRSISWEKGYYTSASNFSKERLGEIVRDCFVRNNYEPFPIICLGKEATLAIQRVTTDCDVIPLEHPGSVFKSSSQFNDWMNFFEKTLEGYLV